MAQSSRSYRTSALAGTLALLLGAGLTATLATSAASASPAGHRTTTWLRGFSTAPATRLVGGPVTDRVSIRPRAHRHVLVQARRPGSTVFHTVWSASGYSNKQGDFQAAYRPTNAGHWKFRLVLPRTTRATRFVSPSRTIIATASATKDSTAPGPVTAVNVVPGNGSDLVLSWTNPTDPDFAGVIIRRALGSTAPASPQDGDAVATTDATTTFTDQGLADDTTYSYALFAFDSAKNNAVAATGTQTSGAVTTAALSVGGSTGTAETKMTVNGGDELFDLTASHAGTGLELVSGTLDFGDGTPPEEFTGDPATWVTAHEYSVTGHVTATWTVEDSVGTRVTTVRTIQVFDAPTATIKLHTNRAFEKNKPVRFDVTSTTPTGTSFTDHYTFSGDYDQLKAGNGAPPATFQMTFPAPGTYTVTVEGFNDAGGQATKSVDVVIVD